MIIGSGKVSTISSLCELGLLWLAGLRSPSISRNWESGGNISQKTKLPK